MRTQILLVLLLTQLAGCSIYKDLTRDPRDAPWDPKPGQQLFDQAPAWNGAASRVCCGHLRSCGPGQSPRC